MGELQSWAQGLGSKKKRGLRAASSGDSITSGQSFADSIKTGMSWAPLVAQMVKNLPANAGYLGSIPGSGRSPGGGHGSPLQYSCLENPVDREAWQFAANGVAKSRT